MKKIKKSLTIGLTVLLMLCMSISFMGCVANTITPTPDKFYLLLEDTRGNQYELYAEYESDKTIYCQKTIFIAVEDTNENIGFYVRGLYDMDGKPFNDDRFFQEAKEDERAWAYPLNKEETYDFLKVYYINKFNEKNVFIDTYIVHFEVQVNIG